VDFQKGLGWLGVFADSMNPFRRGLIIGLLTAFCLR
jgi:hypothetical protein